MSRRSVNPGGRRVTDGGLPTVAGLLHPKSRSPPVLTIALLVLGVIVIIAYFNSGSGVTVTSREALIRSEGSCTSEVIQALPYINKVYGSDMQKVLHVGLDTCTVVSNLLKEGKVEKTCVYFQLASPSLTTLVHRFTHPLAQAATRWIGPWPVLYR